MDFDGKITSTTLILVGAVAVTGLYLFVLNKPAPVAQRPRLPINRPLIPSPEPVGTPAAPATPPPTPSPNSPITLAGVYMTGPDGAIDKGVPLGVWYQSSSDTWYATILIQYTDGSLANQFIPVMRGAGNVHPSAVAINYVLEVFKASVIGMTRPS